MSSPLSSQDQNLIYYQSLGARQPPDAQAERAQQQYSVQRPLYLGDVHIFLHDEAQDRAHKRRRRDL